MTQNVRPLIDLRVRPPFSARGGQNGIMGSPNAVSSELRETVGVLPLSLFSPGWRLWCQTAVWQDGGPVGQPNERPAAAWTFHATESENGEETMKKKAPELSQRYVTALGASIFALGGQAVSTASWDAKAVWRLA